MSKCEHQKERTRCRECGGGSYCEHDRLRGNCPICSTEKIFQRYQRQAAQRKLSFSLTLSQFESIAALPCVLCGDYGSGVDRKDSRVGYIFSENPVLNNVQPMCGVCNRWKSRMSMPTVLSHVEKICRYREKLRKKLAVSPQVAA
jgi:hypothetical protein